MGSKPERYTVRISSGMAAAIRNVAITEKSDISGAIRGLIDEGLKIRGFEE